MKRVIALALLAASVILVLVVGASAGPDGHKGGKTIRVVEHATTDAITNGTTGDDVGNILTIAIELFDGADTQQVLAITGGTGKYRNARGEMELKFHNPAGTKFDFIFHVIG